MAGQGPKKSRGIDTTVRSDRVHTSNAWSQQQGETPAAFACFCAFRDLGPGRKIVTLSKEPIPFLGRMIKYQQLTRAATKWQWKHRASAWDRHLDSKRQGAQGAAAQKSARQTLKTSRAGQRICYRYLMSTVRRLEGDAQDQLMRKLDTKDMLELATKMISAAKQLQEMDIKYFGGPDQVIQHQHAPGFLDSSSKDIMRLIRKDPQALEMWTQFMYRVDELRLVENKSDEG